MKLNLCTEIGFLNGMGMNCRTLLILLCVLPVLSCQRYDVDVEKAIAESGGNASGYIELLESYRQSDTLKYKAASFLIANMLYHISDSVIEQSKDWEEYMSVYLRQRIDTINETDKHNAAARVGKLPPPIVVKNVGSDIAVLSPKFIRDNIEYSFGIWRTSPYCRNLSWEEFLEYILPYRSIQEPVYMGKKELSQVFYEPIIGNGETKDVKDILYGFRFRARFIRLLHKASDHQNWGIYTPFMPIKKYDCNILSAYTGDILRALGIPVSINFTPQWNNSDLGHTWCVTYGDSCRHIPFSPPFIDITQDTERIKHAPKIYQMCFGVNHDAPYFKLRDKESIPHVLNSPTIKDVTDSYLETVTLRIPVNRIIENQEAIFLSVFNKSKSNCVNPVACGLYDAKSKSYVFCKVPINHLFFPTFFDRDSGKYIPCLRPLIIRRVSCGGKKSYKVEYPIKKSSGYDSVKLTLTRKYPVKDHIKKYLKDFKEAIIVASNSLSERGDTLFTFCDGLSPYMQRFTFRNLKPYRFYRIISKDQTPLYVAEHQWLSNLGKSGTPALPLPILSLSDSVRNAPEFYEVKGTPLFCDATSRLSYDGDSMTFSESPWIGVDFGSSVVVTGVQLLPQNSNNGIVEGDVYELYYYRDGAWIRHSSKQAQYNYIEFDNVPASTLYWLRNLTEGKEELPFFYVDGTQVFIDSL